MLWELTTYNNSLYRCNILFVFFPGTILFIFNTIIFFAVRGRTQNGPSGRNRSDLSTSSTLSISSTKSIPWAG